MNILLAILAASVIFALQPVQAAEHEISTIACDTEDQVRDAATQYFITKKPIDEILGDMSKCSHGRFIVRSLSSKELFKVEDEKIKVFADHVELIAIMSQFGTIRSNAKPKLYILVVQDYEETPPL